MTRDTARETARDIGPASPPAPDANLPAEIRQQLVCDLVQGRGFVRVRELSERFGVSAVTVRSDLDSLEAQSLVRRVHGGAMSNRRAVERSFEEVAADLRPQKSAIGRAAAELVSSGDAVAIDVGTTTAALTAALVARRDLDDVTVFTNGLNVALALEAASPRITVVVTGGTLRPKQHSLVDPMARSMLANIRVSMAFLGCNGIDAARGVTNVNLPEAEVKRAMVAAADRRVVVADSSTIGVTALATIAPLDDIDVLVTDTGITAAQLDELRSRGLDVVVAQ